MPFVREIVYALDVDQASAAMKAQEARDSAVTNARLRKVKALRVVAVVVATT